MPNSSSDSSAELISDWELEDRREREKTLADFLAMPLSKKLDKVFAFEILSDKPWLLEHFPSNIKEDKDFILSLVKEWPQSFQWTSSLLRNERPFALQCIQEDGRLLEFCSDRLKADRDFVMIAITQNGGALEWASPELCADKALVIEALSNSSDAAEWISESLRADRKFIEIAVKLCPSIIRYASKEIRFDKDYIWRLIERADCYYSLPDEMKADQDIALTAMRSGSGSLYWIPKSLLGNHDFIKKAVKIDGNIYSSASDAIKADVSIFKDALRYSKKPDAPLLKEAPSSIRDDRSLALTAIQFHWSNVQWIGQPLRNDREIILAAIRSDDTTRSNLYHAIYYASDALKKSKEFIKEAVAINWLSFSSADISLKEDVGFVREVLAINPNVIEFAAESVCKALGVPMPTPIHVCGNGGICFRRLIVCEKCNFEDVFLQESYSYSVAVYEFDTDVYAPFRSEWRWCNECKALSRTEMGYDAKARLEQLAVIESQNPSPVALRNARKWAKTERGDRCLHCGGQDLSSMTETRLNATEDGPSMWHHQGCGGRFIVKSDSNGIHFNRRQRNDDDPINYIKYNPLGFPCSDLKTELSKEFPNLSQLVFDLVDAEVKRALSIPISTTFDRKAELELEYPELAAAICKFVRGQLDTALCDESFEDSFPEVYVMFRHEARRIIEAARDQASVSATASRTTKVVQGFVPTVESKKSETFNSALHRNPFLIIGAHTRDTRLSVIEKAEERSLHSNPEECQKARSDLTNPRTRIAAEIAWLPGVSPRAAEKLVSDVASSPLDIASQTGLPELARANLMSSALELVDAETIKPNEMAHFMRLFAEVAEDIDSETVMRDINEDRSVAGFPEVRDQGLIDEELEQQKKKYKLTLKGALNNMPSALLVETMVRLVNESTGQGEQAAPPLIDDLVDSYEVETQSFLSKEQDNIVKLLERTLVSAPTGAAAVDSCLENVEKVVQSWARVAKPIQVSMKSRGLEHKHSLQIGYAIRSLGIDLFNEHNLLPQAQRTTRLLLTFFGDMPEFKEKVQTDAATLEGLKKKAAESEAQEAEQRRLITYKAELGVVFKDELSISPEGIRWKNKHYELESINGIRWGAVKRSVNGIPSGTDYTIAFGDGRGSSEVNPSKEVIYSRFVNCLWRAVGVRLLYEMANGLKEGRSFTFGGIEIEDGAVKIERHKFLGANETVRLPISQVKIWSSNGHFVVGASNDAKVYSSASYISDWNTHVLEHMMRTSFEKGSGGSLSAYFLS